MNRMKPRAARQSKSARHGCPASAVTNHALSESFYADGRMNLSLGVTLVSLCLFSASCAARPALAPPVARSAAAASTQFGFAVYERLRIHPGNVVFSP